MKLSIVTMFYDGSIHILEKWLKNVEQNVKVEHEIVIVDNTTAQSLQAEGVKVVHSGGNVYQFEGRRYGVEASIGDYIWLVDSDDIILPLTSFDYDEDIICCNYMGTEPGDNNMYPCGQPYPMSYTVSKTDFFMECWKETVKNMVWNKFYKKDLLQRVYSKIPKGLRIIFMEDTLLNLFCLLETKSIHFDTNAYYLYFFDTGVSTKKMYTTIESLETLFIGFRTAMGLYVKAVPEERIEHSGIGVIPLLRGSAIYFLEKFNHLSKGLEHEYAVLLIKNFEDVQFLIECLNDPKLNMTEEKKKKVLKYLNDSI